jgi:hypothetical protein
MISIIIFIAKIEHRNKCEIYPILLSITGFNFKLSTKIILHSSKENEEN